MPHPALPRDDHDRLITSRLLDAEAPWLDPDEPVTPGHVLCAAQKSDSDPAAVRSRLAELGYRVPSPEQLATATEDDLQLLKLMRYRSESWLGPEDSVFLRHHLLRAADDLKRPPAELAARLAGLGLPSPPPESLPGWVPEYGDLTLTRYEDRPLPDDVPVPVHHILQEASYWEVADDPQRALREVVSVCERLVELGYRVDPVVLAMDAEDLTLLGGNPGDEHYRLHLDRPVPLPYVLRLAQGLDRTPDDIAARLHAFGHRLLPEGPLPRSVEPGDLDLFERGWRTLLARNDPDWFAHLVVVGARTGRAPADIADRLRSLGFTIPEAELPAGVSSDDVGLIDGRPAVSGETVWLPRTEPVPVGHVLFSAHARETGTAAVVTRMRELGYTRVPDVPDRNVTDDDLRLISTAGDGSAPVLADTVPYGRVVGAAAVSGAGPEETAARYRGLGYTDVVLPDGPLPASVDGRDALLTVTGTGWLALDEAVPVPHVVARAHAEGAAPAEVARRLRTLGYRDVPSGLPETPHPGDLAMISRDGRRGAPYVPLTGVTAGHVRCVADVLESSAHDVALRMLDLGYALEFTPHPDDAVVVSLNADGRAPWLGRGGNLGHVLLVAKALGRTPEEVVARLAELGYEKYGLPGTAAGDEDTDDDIVLLSENADGRGPWIRQWSADLGHVLRAARATGRTPQEVGARMALLGHHVHVPSQALASDLDLVEALPGPHRPWGTGDLLAAASRTGRSPADAAARLRVLGKEVADLDYPTRRPAPGPAR
ncbi:wHTH domain-containing protein [Streptomyces apricus]|uniref:wHTH-Hsp90 Na associated domain-containing protein n=1 Tax=Streptomyces apricus TaxID=1828112 RepID=A0A5B0A6T9_9ACTN|nr:hypothetical protein [Streptomyces apricus]KAA0924901.1 hypothetical protein FGF04_32945 [Streptomyces apricus]